MRTGGWPLTSGASRSVSRLFSRSQARPECAESFGEQSLDFVPSGAPYNPGTSSRSQPIPKSRFGLGSGFPQAYAGHRNLASLVVGKGGYLEASSRLPIVAGDSEGALSAEIASSARWLSAPLRMPVSSIVDQRCPAAGTNGPQPGL